MQVIIIFNTLAPKTMVIGWDSADFELILPWVRKGYMPYLSKLLDHSRWGKLKSVCPPVTASAWSTIVTGKNAGKHGIYEFMRFRPNTYDTHPVNAHNRMGKDVWEILSEYSKRVVVIGVPLTYPIRQVNGCIVSGFMTPNETVDYSYPKHIKDELISVIPGYSVNPSHVFRADSGDNDEDYTKSLFEILHKHIEGAVYLAKNKEWDFFMAVFNETDWCQHRFWYTIDPYHPLHNKKGVEKYSSVIRDVHIKLDEALGRLIEIAGEKANIMLLSDHGVSPLYKFLNTNAFLYGIGKLRFRRRPGTLMRYALAKIGFNQVRMRRLPKRLNISSYKLSRSTSVRNKKEMVQKFFLSENDIDWSRTEAFSPFGNGLIFINKIGSFPRGIVTESNYEKIRQEIIYRLDNLFTENIKLVENVFKREQLFSGPNIKSCPDIQFQSSRGYFPIGSFSYGATNLLIESNSVSGTHSMEGIIILKDAGGEILDSPSVNNSNLVDIAPTILQLMGVPVPPEMDGKSLTRVSTDTLRPIRDAEQDHSHETGMAGELTKEEEKDIEERLRSLGYV